MSPLRACAFPSEIQDDGEEDDHEHGRHGCAVVDDEVEEERGEGDPGRGDGEDEQGQPGAGLGPDPEVCDGQRRPRRRSCQGWSTGYLDR
jgi:hypothetical protein